MSDDKLRAAFNTHAANNAPRDRSACPSPEQLQSLAESGQGGNSTNLKMLDHVFGCAYCRADFALLRTVQSGVQSMERDDGLSGKNRNTNRGWLSGSRLAIAATLLLAIGIGGESLRRSRATAVRDAGSDANDVMIVSPVAKVLIAPDAAFVWRKVAGAVTYEIQLLDTTGVVIASQMTADTVFKTDADIRARIGAVGALDWFVSAKRDDGNERRSAVMRVQVKR